MNELPINKGINKPIEFKGLKAQYIGYLAVGLIVLLILFAILYVLGVQVLVCVGIAFGLGTALFVQVFRLSHRYGEHGLMKATAHRQVPETLVFRSRQVFLNLKSNNT
ncbi:hypothetical protein AWW67_13215 [Roseivirga seohaensis]|jgi:hypothetical protein|uniref:Conjugal transfer protein TraF n=1 Tax=Roseivirga seohaensis TaxID=1914963 RepID=A0A150XKR1_9BACT|nr:DUF4133 domain-containing protein [Roseivirga seohaensis]KYG79328.1 hypothetical protein AWW67_13215 [Roseivirga seohaensis]|tara:strand:- start:1373 stop:1696 length:324 start_codon:yes stop_codon:yes gene_type:complete